jgi:pyruvate/2-oxoacid:ferredoxin oxidoreductase beta subunit/Pyruvate/2-oxoacid:ferredoxin oxidoreductase gamma subunit
MSTPFLNTPNLPFCKGCGHDLIAKSTAQALETIGLNPLDVIMVTDIGCHGIIDKTLNTHTVHGLHGRSVALGAGVSFAMENTNKKVIVFLGDGGATIGLQHIIEASRMNLNLTIVIHNNMLYGMTGGQTSGLTPTGFRTTTAMDGNPFSAHDICKLTHTAGAAYVTRILGIGNIADKLAEAYSVKGCSVVEVVEICPSYGVKFNPKRKLSEIMESMGHTEGVWTNDRLAYTYPNSSKMNDLLAKLPVIEQKHTGGLDKHYQLVMTGSAGEGVQVASAILARAALSSGYQVTQKGSYPVTVGVGFSTSEVNISPEAIHYHGMASPNAILVTSLDGLNHQMKRINAMKDGLLLIDSSLEEPSTGAKVVSHDFRIAGPKNAALYSLLMFANITGLIKRDAIIDALNDMGLGEKIPVEKIEKLLNS